MLYGLKFAAKLTKKLSGNWHDRMTTLPGGGKIWEDWLAFVARYRIKQKTKSALVTRAVMEAP